MVGREWPDALAFAGFVLAALLILVGVIRDRTALIAASVLLVAGVLAAWPGALATWWGGELLTLALLAAAWLVVVVLTRR